jgi:hypothetical protein
MLPENSTDGFSLDLNAVGTWYEFYKDILGDLTSKIKDRGGIVVSERAFASAFAEVSKDLKIMSYRRQIKKDGISQGKIAAVFIFRLVRWNIISLPLALANDEISLKLNYLAALAFGLNLIGLDISKVPTSINVELAYTVMRRHINQETLGLCLDVLNECYK